MIKVHDGSTLTMYFDSAKDLLYMSANVKDGSYLGFGWGATMSNTEMLVWSADGDNSEFSAYYSYGNEMPKRDLGMEACYYT